MFLSVNDKILDYILLIDSYLYMLICSSIENSYENQGMLFYL